MSSIDISLHYLVVKIKKGVHLSFMCEIKVPISLPKTQFPKIKPLHISENGVFMLLDRIDVSKSSGPDKLPGRLMPSLAKEITLVVHFIIIIISLFSHMVIHYV